MHSPLLCVIKMINIFSVPMAMSWKFHSRVNRFNGKLFLFFFLFFISMPPFDQIKKVCRAKEQQKKPMWTYRELAAVNLNAIQVIFELIELYILDLYTIFTGIYSRCLFIWFSLFGSNYVSSTLDILGPSNCSRNKNKRETTGDEKQIKEGTTTKINNKFASK